MVSVQKGYDMGQTVFSKVKMPDRKVNKELLLPAQEEVEFEVAEDHRADPIKSLLDIQRITDFLVREERYRDNMLFICGINFGLRIGDLLQLTFSRIIDETCTFRTTFPILETKTKNTRKVKRNRYLTINEAVMEAVRLYLEHNPSRFDEYMFKSESRNGGSVNKPLSRMSVDRMLKGIAKDLSLTYHLSSHSLRKTFGYHQMVMSGNDPRKLIILQKIFGHSSITQTMEYIGITNEEIAESYMSLNLGSKKCYDRFSVIEEAVI